MDLAEVIYCFHRCVHGHGDELPEKFTLLEDAAGPALLTRMEIEKHYVRMSDRVIFGLLSVAVLSPQNTLQSVPDGYHLSFGTTKIIINDWWGRAIDFLKIVDEHPMPKVTLNFGDWMVES